MGKEGGMYRDDCGKLKKLTKRMIDVNVIILNKSSNDFLKIFFFSSSDISFGFIFSLGNNFVSFSSSGFLNLFLEFFLCFSAWVSLRENLQSSESVVWFELK